MNLRLLSIASLLAAAIATACGTAADDTAPATGTTETISETPADNRLFKAQDLGLLDATDRDQWQKPDLIMDALKIAEGSVVADIGAGGGWFTIRLARRVQQNGRVYAEDIQSEMLAAIKQRVQRENLARIVEPIQGSSTDPNLPAGALDAALIVDAYSAIDDPAVPSQIVTLLRNVNRSLKPQGCLGVVDFEQGGGGPGPGPQQRVDPEVVVRAATAAGLRLVKREAVPPFQFLLVFGKTTSPSRCAA